MFNALAASWSLVVGFIVVNSAILQYISLKPEADVLGNKSKHNGPNQAKKSLKNAKRNNTLSHRDLRKPCTGTNITAALLQSDILSLTRKVSMKH